MRKLRAKQWLRQRWLGTALGALLVTLAKAPPCFAAPAPATPGSGQRTAADCAEAPPAGARPLAKAEESDGSSRTVVTLLVAGVGVAGLTTGIAYELLARSNNREAAELCRAGSEGGSCADVAERDRHRRLASAADRDRQIGLVALSVGGAALVTTAVLLLTGHAQAHPDDTPELSMGLVDGHWGATLGGRF
jgi:hypothetical protein